MWLVQFFNDKINIDFHSAQINYCSDRFLKADKMFQRLSEIQIQQWFEFPYVNFCEF